jgi:hypothetical protein
LQASGEISAILLFLLDALIGDFRPASVVIGSTGMIAERLAFRVVFNGRIFFRGALPWQLPAAAGEQTRSKYYGE